MGETFEDINKPGWKPKFQSEFSMGALDFVRFDKTLTYIDELSGRVNSCHLPPLDLMQEFFAQLNNLYDDFRPLISTKTITEELDRVIESGVDMKRFWENNYKTGIPISQQKVFEFIDLCRQLKRKLYSIKQVIGLGIVVRRNMSTREKIRAGIKGHTGKFEDLPEA